MVWQRKKKTHKLPRLTVRAKDYLIREIKARPVLERLARKLLYWWRSRRSVAGPADLVAGAQDKHMVTGTPFASQVKVATILDEFSFGSFACEFKAIPVEPDNWRERFENEKPDVFFCESAWSGPDSVRRPWKGQVYASVNFKNENRGALLSILNYCNLNAIPTVFWNKEDPTHFGDKVHDFIKTAQLFDFVFTTAEECVARYRQDYGCKNVFALPFASQPRMFNPLELDGSRTEDIVFAGSWYSVHKERSQLMEQVLDRFVKDGYSLKLIDRYFGTKDENHIFPERFRSYLFPPVEHKKINSIYKSSLFGLNFNTVTTSSTMFARRVFELISSNTLVLSNYSLGMDKMFGKDVVFVDRDPARLKGLSKQEIDVIRERALHNVLENHTYENRWEFILDSIGFYYRKNDKAVTLVSRINNHDEARASIVYFSQVEALIPNSRLLLLLSKMIPDDEVAAYYQEYNRYGSMVVCESFLEKYSDPEANIIYTANMLFVTGCRFPPLSWLDKARLHLCYAGERYIGFDAEEAKYSVVPLDLNKSLLSSSSGFLPLLTKKNHNSWNSVFYV
ncbi:hypothetical protein DKP76_18435 [Falsochrobactrum shanghaiense]|uniref:Spore protein YkvP/CgeB glycosyl transferase-like domain-containing protein n=2 Tax=Falsochrobactrum shanghaiense TaxID=2201899 RepID=A0A316J3J2_9HYPH|nr:hypothetical protein DKP76_18435 [Falsochrobactrum shanghaiense]